MRAILILNDMPSECIECPFHRIYADGKLTETSCTLIGLENEDGVNTRAEWCPLKIMPKPMKPVIARQCKQDDPLYQEGWNDCLKEIEE